MKKRTWAALVAITLGVGLAVGAHSGGVSAAEHESQCFKHEGTGSNEHGTANGSTVTLNPFNQDWPGDHWESLTIKGGSDSNGGGSVTYDHPEAGVPYSTLTNPQSGYPFEVSHWIVCKGVTPVPPTTTTTPPPPWALGEECGVFSLTGNYQQVSVTFTGGPAGLQGDLPLGPVTFAEDLNGGAVQYVIRGIGDEDITGSISTDCQSSPSTSTDTPTTTTEPPVTVGDATFGQLCDTADGTFYRIISLNNANVSAPTIFTVSVSTDGGAPVESAHVINAGATGNVSLSTNQSAVITWPNGGQLVVPATDEVCAATTVPTISSAPVPSSAPQPTPVNTPAPPPASAVTDTLPKTGAGEVFGAALIGLACLACGASMVHAVRRKGSN